ncbi:hypothetical protein [Clostridium akagii]|uniref:hypothetical protein n=1 Tax=Clostridium akagii TaxID=91623 RepID=UPI000478C666|nr:hypothetical protein [Clostridium akagii]
MILEIFEYIWDRIIYRKEFKMYYPIKNIIISADGLKWILKILQDRKIFFEYKVDFITKNKIGLTNEAKERYIKKYVSKLIRTKKLINKLKNNELLLDKDLKEINQIINPF